MLVFHSFVSLICEFPLHVLPSKLKSYLLTNFTSVHFGLLSIQWTAVLAFGIGSSGLLSIQCDRLELDTAKTMVDPPNAGIVIREYSSRRMPPKNQNDCSSRGKQDKRKRVLGKITPPIEPRLVHVESTLAAPSTSTPAKRKRKAEKTIKDLHTSTTVIAKQILRGES